jgi:nucleoid-associated protein YgaU
MPKKAQVKKSAVKKILPAKVKNTPSFLSQIKWGESYTSLFLGAVVVVIGLILLFSFLKTRTTMNQETGSASTNVEEKVTPTTYTVKQGDDLWTIAKNLYGSGYNWVDLASANKLQNPGVLYVGSKLIVPDVKPIIVENQEVVVTPTVAPTISANTYTIVKGDDLWHIAVRAYGDGYKWVEIARANHLVNPNVIHSGNVLVLPR